MEDTAALKRRLEALLRKPENRVCCDCEDRNPSWASLIVPPPNSPDKIPTIGAVCCMQCSGLHRSLGTHICFVRSIRLDTWKQTEVVAMELGGNKRVNEIFEGKIAPPEKPDSKADQDTRLKYIRSKYVDRKFFRLEAYGYVGKEHLTSGSSMKVSTFGRMNELSAGFSPVDWSTFPAGNEELEKRLSRGKDQLSLSLHDYSERTRSMHDDCARSRSNFPMSTSCHVTTGLGRRQVGQNQASRKSLPQTNCDEGSLRTGKESRVAPLSNGVKFVPSSSRRQASRSLSMSSSTGRKVADRLKQTSSHSIQEGGDIDFDDSFAEQDSRETSVIEKSAGNSATETSGRHASAGQIAYQADSGNNSFGSLDGGEVQANVVKSASRYRKGNRRMSRGVGRGGRGELSRALSVPNMKARRRGEKNGVEGTEALVSKLKDVLPNENEEKSSRSGSQSTFDQKSRSGDQVSSDLQRSRSAARSSQQRPQSQSRSQCRTKSRSRTSDQQQRRSTSRKRGVGRQSSTGDIKRRPSRSSSGELRRTRRSTAGNASPVNEDYKEKTTSEQSSPKNPSTRVSGSEAPPRRSRISIRSKSDDLVLRFYSSQSPRAGDDSDDDVDINSKMKTSAATHVAKKVVNDDSWFHEGVEFSDEDLFAGTGEELLSEDEEEDSAAAERIPSMRATINVMKGVVTPPALNGKNRSSRPSVDLAALTFYD